MQEITATEAARRFSDILDRVERRHQSFVVTRGGRRVACVSPAAITSGREVRSLLASLRPDPDWAQELLEVRRGLVVEERRWPG